jgi:endonuclease III
LKTHEICHILLSNFHKPINAGAHDEVTWKQMFSIDAMVEQFKHLNINREGSNFAQLQHNAVVPYNTQNQEHNALVLYKRDGTVVPFEGLFDPIKKRRPRPKVDLDDETNRVWKLLLENINNQGIDGTDEEKAKWWEEERRVFRGRADSFIARMHLVQGDRRFSQWKGSVLDSVVGVFLTQNVSDHLSSSAFMSLAARFPLKSSSNQKACYEEGLSFVVNKPEVCILDPEDSIQWKPVCDQSSMTLHDPEHNEEKEVVNSNESPGGSTVAETACYTGGGRLATNYSVSSQDSAFSSQNSSPVQTAENIGSCLERNSEADYLLNGSKPNCSDGFTSIVELQQMAGSIMLNEVYSHGTGNAPSDENSKDACNESKGMNHDNQRQDTDKLNDPQSSLGASMSPSSNCQLHLTYTSRVLEVECPEMFKEETHSFDISHNKDEISMTEQSALTVESSSQATVQNKLTMNAQKAPRSSSKSGNSVRVYENGVIPSQSQALGDPKIVESLAQGQNIEVLQNLPNISGETQDVTQKTAESDSNAHGYSFSTAIREMNAATIKAKRRRVGLKDRKDNVNWDNLRKQVEANGTKSERAANTMDSLDWEAVRCADVNDIANTIKERGMNNMLAERIKDFLNRLVREHGSIDLEWLRDVPPDQAKEYLLSVRGLGLKSVECVRLLTLHHLAFPVSLE